MADGYAALEELGYRRADFRTASLGKSKDGDPQLLVLGNSHIEIRSIDGEVLLDVGIREIRGVRAVKGEGLNIWVTSLGGEGELRDRRWVHLIADHDASYLDQCWLDMDPYVQEGPQLVRLPWREEECAYYVGRALTEAARCEVQISSLLALLEGSGWKFRRSPMGLSGTQLADAMEEVGRDSAAFRDLAERYRAWYLWRNFSAHGIRMEHPDAANGNRVLKLRRSPNEAGDIFDVEDQDFRDLATLWRAFYFLAHDAFRIFVDLSISQDSLAQALAALKVPNSVDPGERMPSPDGGESA